MTEKQIVGLRRDLNISATNVASPCRITNIDPIIVMILPHDANVRRMKFSETTGAISSSSVRVNRGMCGSLLRRRPTEKEIEAGARKLCLRAFEPYTYGPYFDALRAEYRKKAREILEARERTEEYAVIGQLDDENKS